MIVDDIIASIFRHGDPAFAEKWSRATVIRVPYSLGGVGSKGSDRLIALLPPGNVDLLSCNAPWAHPPYPLTILVSDDNDEHTALFVEQYPVDPNSTVKWQAKAVLMTYAPEGRIAAPVAIDSFEQREDGVTYDTSVDPDKMTGEQKAELNTELTELFNATARILLESGNQVVKDHIEDRMMRTRSFLGVLLYEVVTAFALMGCRNIDLRDTPPSRQVRRAAARAGLPAPFTVKTLVVRPLARRKQTDSDAPPNNDAVPIALHWVRGHFKTFTAEKPLLGRATGTFWWTPHLAGSKEAGVVVKDYKIDVKREGKS